MMKKIAEFIVDRRNAFIAIFFVAFVYCLLSINRVNVNEDITKYLPIDTETRAGNDIMTEEFQTYGRAEILVTNITYDRALSIAKDLDNLDGVNMVDFYDPDDDDYYDKDISQYYKDSSAFYTLVFDDEKGAEITQKGIKGVRDYLKDYDAYVYTEVDKDDSVELRHDVSIVFVLAIFIIIAVLLFTSKTYMEVPIFMVVFGMAGILNKGTNYIFGEISYISNSVDMILQLALAIDYAIIFFHRFMEERDKGLSSRDACIESLSKAIIEISSSSLTTIGGLFSFVFMTFTMGRDVGLVLCKAICISMLTVFTFMPALIMMFARQIDATRHRSFVPRVDKWGRFIFASRYILSPIFLCVVAIGIYLSSKCPYAFDVKTPKSINRTSFIIARDRINETFDAGTMMAIVVPAISYQTEGEIVSRLKEYEKVEYVTALADVKVGDAHEYVLTDSLTPREFADIAGLDTGLATLLYSAYAEDKGAYAAFVDGIDEYRVFLIDMIDFVYEQKEKGAFSLSKEQSEDLDDIYKSIQDARNQLEGENHHRIVFKMNGEVEGDEAFKNVDEIRAMVQSYYKDRIFIVSDTTADEDLMSSFAYDNILISGLTAFFVGVILFFTFQSALLPFLLLLTIEGSILINFGVPAITGTPVYFWTYLLVSAIQMGATIDYAIVITNRYVELRKVLPGKKEAIIESLNASFATVLTSGTIMTSAGFLMGLITSNAVIAQLGFFLGRGTLISIILVMTVLPQILYIFDPLLDKTSFEIKQMHALDHADDTVLYKKKTVMQVDGKVNGYFEGYINGSFTGRLEGIMDFKLSSSPEGMRDAWAASPNGETADVQASSPDGEAAEAQASSPDGETADAQAASPDGEAADAQAVSPDGEAADAQASSPLEEES